MLKAMRLLAFILCCILIPGVLFAKTKSELVSTLSIENHFIKIIVNNEPFDTGRLAIETTSGRPNYPKDDNQPLIFGRPKPWTSYTTILIDGEPYVFGGPTKKRAGKVAKYGKFLGQRVDGDTLISTTLFGKIKVVQTLEYIRNPLTKVKDTALISYEIFNDDSVQHLVGVRIMLDTMLGSNDGAPFRIGNAAIDSEIKFSGNEILDYWQTFDDLTKPTVIAQGTLRLPDFGIQPPNSIILVNWGTVADHPWDFTYIKERKFIRVGETEKDTALAMYWNPVVIGPLASNTIQTTYGIGGVTVAPGELSLGLAAPAEVYSTSKSEMLIVGYVLNSGGYDSKDTIATFQIPSGFKVVGGKTKFKLGNIPSEQSRQVAIKVIPKSPRSGKKSIRMNVTSSTLDKNTISRRIEVLAPPRLGLGLTIEDDNRTRFKPYINAKLTIKNTEAFPINNIKASLHPDRSLQFPWFEFQTKRIKHLKAGSSSELNWKLRIMNGENDTHSLSVKVGSPLTLQQHNTAKVSLKTDDSFVGVKLSKDTIKRGDYFFFDIVQTEKLSSQNQVVSLSFNSDYFDYLRHTPATRTITHIDNSLSFEYETTGVEYYKSLMKYHFQALQAGKTDITLSLEGKPIQVLSVIIEE